MSHPFGGSKQPGATRSKHEQAESGTSGSILWQAPAAKRKTLLSGTAPRALATRRAPGRPRKVHYEPLEPRLLLSADAMPFTVALSPDGSDDYTLSLNEATSSFDLFDNRSGMIVASQQIDETSQINIIGSEGDDHLTLDLGDALTLPSGIHFDAGGGNDSLTIIGDFESMSLFLDQDDGTIDLESQAGDLEIAFEDLEGLADRLIAAQKSYEVAGSETVDVRGDGGGFSLLPGGGTAISVEDGGDSLSIQASDAGAALNFGGSLDLSGQAAGETGGDLRLLADTITLSGDSYIGASGEAGGGTVLIGGDVQGSGNFSKAENVYVDYGALIDASATGEGSGGKVVIWAEGYTGFGGDILARGAGAGDGGFAEVSGKEKLHFRGGADLGADSGRFGTLLLDPRDVTIDGVGGDDTMISGDGIINDSDATAPTDVTILQSTLEALTGAIVIQADRNIIFAALASDELRLADGATSLTLTADFDADGNGDITFTDTTDTVFSEGADLIFSAASMSLANLNTLSLATPADPDGDVTLETTDAGGITLASVTADNLVVTAEGNIAQTGTSSLVVGGTATFTTASGDVTLENLGNDFEGVVSAVDSDDTSVNSVSITDADDITLGDFSTFGDTITIDASTVKVTADADFTLSGDSTNATLTVDTTAFALSGTSQVEMTGGAGANTIDASGYSGNTVQFGQGGDDTLIGGTGNDTYQGGADNDTYVLDDSFGADVLNGAGFAGFDVLDFTAHSAALTMNADRSVITGNGVDTLTQSTTESQQAEAVDLLLDAAGLGVAISGAFAGLTTLRQNRLVEIKELTNKIPVLSDGQNDDGFLPHLRDLSGLVEAIDELDARVTAATQSDISLQDFIDQLAGMTTVDNVDVDVTIISQGYQRDTSDSNHLEATLGFDLIAAVATMTGLDLGPDGEFYGIVLGGDFTITGGFATSGMELVVAPWHGSTKAYFEPDASWSLTVNGDYSITTAQDLDIGFLDAEIDGTTTPGTIHFDGEMIIALGDPNSDGKLTASELGNASNIDDVNDVDTVAKPFTVDVGDSFTDLDTDDLLAANLFITVGDTGPSDGIWDDSSIAAFAGAELQLSLADSIFSGTPLTLTSSGSIGDPFDFSTLSANEMLGMISEMIISLSAFANSELADVPIPYTGKTLGELLNYGAAMREAVLDPLFESGDASVPDIDGDGDPDYTFDSIQEVVSAINTLVGGFIATPVTAIYRPELAVGGATVNVLTEGGGGENELLALSLGHAKGGTFDLSFDDGGTIGNITGLAYDIDAATLEAEIETSTDGDFATLTDVTVTGGNGVFLIEIAAPADTDVGALSVDDSNLVSAPVRVLVEGGSGDNEKVVIDLQHAIRGTFDLTFDGGPAITGLAHDITAADLKTAIEGGTSLDDVTVTGGDGIYVIEVGGSQADTNVGAFVVDDANIDRSPEAVLQFDLSRTFGFGSVEAGTDTPGTGSQNEIQTIMVDAESGDFKLGFTPPNADSTNEFGFSADIDASSGTLAADIETALQNLIDSVWVDAANTATDDVSVALVDGVFEVTFEGDLANMDIEQLSAKNVDLVKTFPLDFGFDLGAFAEIEAASDFTIASKLGLVFDFGIVLEASEEIQIEPGLFEPGAGAVTATVTEGSPSANEVQRLTITNATSGTIFLFNPDDYNPEDETGTKTADLDVTTLTAGSLEAAIETLPGFADVTVTEIAPGTFDIEVMNPGNEDVPPLVVDDSALVGTLDDGVLTGDAVFSFEVIDQPAVAVTTPEDGISDADADGGVGGNEVQQITIINANGGSFTLSYEGVSSTPLTVTAEPLGGFPVLPSAATVQAALETIAALNGNITVSHDLGSDFYTVEFNNALAKTDVATLQADGADLTNSRSTFGPFEVTVAQSDTTGNTSFEDLVADVQAAINENLHTLAIPPGFSFDLFNPLSDDFDPTSALPTGGYTLGYFDSTSGELAVDVTTSPVDALAAPYANPLLFGSDLPHDIRLFVEVPPQGIIAAGPGADQQTLTLIADSGVFKLDFGGEQTAEIDYGASAPDVEAAINAAVTGDGVTVTKDGDVYTITFLDSGSPSNALSGVLAGEGDVTDPLTGFLLPLLLRKAAVEEVRTDGSAEVVETTPGDGATQNEVQTLNITASGGSFGLSFGGDSVTGLAYDISTADLETAIESLTGITDVTVGGTPGSSYTITFEDDFADKALLGVDDGDLTGNTKAERIAQVLGDLINAALDSAGIDDINVTAATDGVTDLLLSLSTDQGTVTLRERPMVEVDAAGRVVLTSPPISYSTSAYEPSVTFERLFQVSIEGINGGASYDNPAFQQMGLLAVPTPSNGVAADDIAFTLLLTAGGSNYELEIAVDADDTDGTNGAANETVDDLIDDLNAVIDTALTGAGLNTGDVAAVRLTDGGYRIGLRGAAGVVERMAIDVPTQLTPSGDLATIVETQAGDGGSNNEIQTLTILGTGGSFELSFGGSDTGGLNYDISAADLETAIETLTGITDVSVSETSPGVYEITFEDDTSDKALLGLDASNLFLRNGAITVLGFESGEGETNRAKATDFFIENAQLGGEFAIVAENIDLSASFGFLGVETDTSASNAVIAGEMALNLVDPFTGIIGLDADPVGDKYDTRLEITPDFNKVLGPFSADHVLFDESEFVPSLDPAEDEASTGNIVGTITGGLDFELELNPTIGGIGGIGTSEILNIDIELGSLPTLSIPGVTLPTLSAGDLGVGLPGLDWLSGKPWLFDPLGIGFQTLTFGDGSGLPGFTFDLPAVNLPNLGAIKFRLGDGSAFAFGELPDIGGIELDDFDFASWNAAIRAVLGQLPAFTGVDFSGLDFFSFSGGKISFDLPAYPGGGAWPDFTFDLPELPQLAFSGADFGGLFSKFQDLDLESLLLALELALDFIRGLDTPFLNVDLPVVNVSLGDFFDFAAELNDIFFDFQFDPSFTLQDFDIRFKDLLGLGSSSTLFDFTTGDLLFSAPFSYEAGSSLPLNLSLGGGDSFVSGSTSGNIDVAAAASLALTMGLDLTSGDGNEGDVFLATSPISGFGATGLNVTASVNENDLDFTGMFGPFSLLVIDGKVRASIDGTVGLTDNGITDRFTLYDASSDIVDVPDASDVALTFADEGSFVAMLPIYTGTVSAPVALVRSDSDPDYPGAQDNVLFVSFNSLWKYLQAPSAIETVDPVGTDDPSTFDFLNAFNNPPEDTIAPIVAVFGLHLPAFESLFNPNLTDEELFEVLLNDPAALVDGLNKAFLFLQEALSGQILGVEIPFLGDVLADNPAAEFIEDFRDDVLTPLAEFLRENNIGLDDLVAELQSIMDGAFSDVILPDGVDSFVISNAFADATATLNGQANPMAQFEFLLMDSLTIDVPAGGFDLGEDLDFLNFSAEFAPVVTL